MTAAETPRDLMVLVADSDTHRVMESLLSTPERLGIRQITFAIESHVGRDPGCRKGSPEFLRSYLGDFRHALVLFDRKGCGSTKTRREIQEQVRRDLAANGWNDRARAIVIAPELEVLVWGSVENLAQVLGWSEGALRRFVTKRGLLAADG